MRIEILHPVRASAERIEVVIPYHVWTPLPSLHVSEERSVSSHVYHVGIALISGHESSFEKGCIKVVPLLSLTMTSVFTSKNLWTLAVIVVITVAVDGVSKPFLIAIEMLIIEVHLHFLHLWLEHTEFVTFRVRTSSANILDFRVLLLQHVKELLESAGEGRIVLIVPLLIADTEESQIERSRMTHVGTHFSPLCVHITISKLDEIESILDVRLKVVERHVTGLLVLYLILELTSQSAGNHRKGITTEVLTELEELEEAKSVSLMIVRI